MAMGSFIRLIAIVTSGIVLLGFAFFAVDQLDEGSKTQQNAVDDGLNPGGSAVAPIAPNAAQESARERDHGKVREVVDDANDILVGPMASLVDSHNAWVEHGIPALLALLIYGLGLGFLANLFPRQRTHGGDWRTAQP
jgi:hypothetical protein